MAYRGFHSCISYSIEASISVKKQLLAEPEALANISAAGDLLVSAFQQGKKALLFGNGGSAADAQHIAAELVGRFRVERLALPAIALNSNSSSVSAIGNDYGFEWVFSRQLEAFGREGDVAVGISTSGRSLNVIKGFCTAKKLGVHTIALTGCAGKGLQSLVDCCICVPSAETPRIQEAHILIGHIFAELVEQAMIETTAWPSSLHVHSDWKPAHA